MIRIIGVREPGVSRPIDASLKALGPLQQYRIERLKGGPQINPNYAETR